MLAVEDGRGQEIPSSVLFAVHAIMARA